MTTKSKGKYNSNGECDSNSNCNCEDTRLSLGFGEIAGSPQIPACYGAPGLPFFCSAVHLVGLGEVHGGDLVGGFEFAEGEGEAFADAVVVDGKNIGAAEAED